MIIELDINKNIDQNAAVYYDAAKKSKKKLLATQEAISKMRLELEKAKKDHAEEEIKLNLKKETAKKEWFEKFRWFVSSEGFLCLGGRDATTNEIVIKKHLNPQDIVFHTEMAGSPFFVIGTDGKVPSEATIKETAIATASFSKAWKLGISHAEVFHVNPEQVTKTAPSGEYVPKGAFMIYGKKTKMNAELKLALGIDNNGKVMCGPIAAIEKNCAVHVKIAQGNNKASDLAKSILKKFGTNAKGISIDDIIRVLPSGGCKIEN